MTDEKRLEKNVMEVYATKIKSLPEDAKTDMVNHPQHYKRIIWSKRNG